MLISKIFDIWPTLRHVSDMSTAFPTKRDTERSNAAQINTLALNIVVVFTAVGVISHGDKIFLLLLLVACGQFEDVS